MNLNYFNPTKIISGKDCLKNYNDFSTVGSRCFIVTSKTGAIKSGAVEDLTEALTRCDIPYEIFAEVEANPFTETCHRAGLLAKEFKADFIVGIGGGSSMDAAKAVAVYASNPVMPANSIFDLKFAMRPLPIVAIGTTVGTGSEVTPFAVLSHNETQNKRSIFHESIFPKIAFLDHTYVKTLPKEYRISTAIDALCHAIEGYFSVKSNLMTETYAEAAMNRTCQGLMALATGRDDDEMLENLLYGATLAGMVIAGTGTCFVHSMGYPLTFSHGIDHGVANSFFIVEFLEKMETAFPVRVMRCLNACGFSNIFHLRSLLGSLVKVDLKLTMDEIEKYTDTVMEAKNLTNSIKVLNRDEIKEIYKKLLP